MTSLEVAQVMIAPLPNSAMIFLKKLSFLDETWTVGAPDIATKP